MKRATDHHSYAKPSEAVTTHLSWDAEVDFASRQIHATATYDLDMAEDAQRVLLDCRGLDIQSVQVDGQAVEFELGPERPFIGQPLSIPVAPTSKQVSVTYSTTDQADAFLWVEGETPFLFTQSQAILARTWVPCQDSPGIRFTYDATVRVPKELMALMSAVNPTSKTGDGVYTVPGTVVSPRASHDRYRARGGVTSGITAPALARGGLITVMPEVGPTPYRARATGYIT